MEERTATWLEQQMRAWGEGPWNDEPDLVIWVDPSTHLICLVKRHAEFGSLCGYVGMLPDLDVHGRGYREDLPGHLGNDDRFRSIDCTFDVHGGITYSDRELPFHPDTPNEICSIPRDYISRVAKELALTVKDEYATIDDYWWFGFDCGHLADTQPGIDARMKQLMSDHDWTERNKRRSSVYRAIEYVKNECTTLAEQFYGLVHPLILLARQAESEPKTDIDLKSPAEDSQ